MAKYFLLAEECVSGVLTFQELCLVDSFRKAFHSGVVPSFVSDFEFSKAQTLTDAVAIARQAYSLISKYEIFADCIRQTEDTFSDEVDRFFPSGSECVMIVAPAVEVRLAKASCEMLLKHLEEREQTHKDVTPITAQNVVTSK